MGHDIPRCRNWYFPPFVACTYSHLCSPGPIECRPTLSSVLSSCRQNFGCPPSRPRTENGGASPRTCLLR
ncbi:hypothetical protein FA95DRAFT_1552507, partial [Auriscalpium vulgare]